MSRDEDETETAESVVNKVLAGRSLLEVFTPRRETMASLQGLRRHPATRAILDGSRLAQASPVSHDETDQSSETRSRLSASYPGELTSDILRMVVTRPTG